MQEKTREAAVEAAAFLEGFTGVSLDKLVAMSDVELALTQSNARPGTPHYILAEKEWERRLAIRAAREARLTALQTAMVGIAGSVIGAIAGFLLTKYF